MIGFGELLVVGVVVLLVIRPEKMPEVLQGMIEAKRLMVRLYSAAFAESKSIKDSE